MKVLFALSISHLLNDTIQAVLPAIYPMLKDAFRLSFAQVGMITLTYQTTASLLQRLTRDLHCAFVERIAVEQPQAQDQEKNRAAGINDPEPDNGGGILYATYGVESDELEHQTGQEEHG